MRGFVALALVLLVPFATAARDQWFGGGPGEFGPNHCDAAYEIEIQRSSVPMRWDVSLTVVPKTDFTAVAVILPQFREECIVPVFHDFPASLGSEIGQWRHDSTSACVDRHLVIAPLNGPIPDAGIASVEWWYRDRCEHIFHMGSAAALVFVTSEPDLTRVTDLLE